MYLRLSLDPNGDKLAIERQREDCTALAQRHGLEIVEYVDRDLSAYKRSVRRPAFEQLLTDVATGALDRIIVYRLDRLARQPRDLERVVDALETSHAELLSVSEPQFVGSAGLLMMRILVAFANNESSVKSERVSRAYRHLADTGQFRSKGRRQFGFELDGSHNEAEAALVREAIGRVLEGEGVSSIRNDWHARGLRTTTGAEWRTNNLSRTLRSPRVAGLSVYHGEVVAQGQWQAIVPEEQWRTFLAMLDHEIVPRREKTTHLLSQLVRCGKCGKNLAPIWWTPPAGSTSRASKFPRYACRAKSMGGCGGVSTTAVRLEGEVTARVLAALDSPLTAEAVAEGAVDQGALLTQLRATEGRLSELASMYAADDITKGEWQAARTKLVAEVDSLKEALTGGPSPLAALGGAGAIRTQWDSQSVAWQRAVIAAVVEHVTLLPAQRSNVWTPERVVITWKA